MELTKEKNKRIQELCEFHKVETLYLFGSVVSENFNKSSDVDVLVKFKKIDLASYFENYMNLKSKLKKIFNREVDLVEEQTLKNPILIQSINKNKALIYG